MSDPIPVRVRDTGLVEYLPSSTRVRCDKPTPRGLGGRRAPDASGTHELRKLGRDLRDGPRITIPDENDFEAPGREADVEGWESEAFRLRDELAQAHQTIQDLRAQLAPTWEREMLAVAEPAPGASDGEAWRR